ncbi:DUF3087 domain-containing protein [Shewanella sp. AS16]|uniref:DUF3087 family protein n=1 Tax=Shewanella sp. AS16 TaxID=2907625 RepID=UPI001F196293|nr:DUF3087 family protein [Shewanella sp. AS16]MCE9687647.1 DUF3087 domain-containing protein [Shewanella sp. AS16]
MKLISIDKQLYRKRTNRLLLGLVASLSLLSLSFGAALIAAFGAAPVAGEPTGNFHWNLLGVILALLLLSCVLHGQRKRPWLKEVYYVWQLKQLHNRIYRKLAKIKLAAARQQPQALIILSFYYASLKQVYLLDNNTLTLSTLERDMATLAELIRQQDSEVSPALFEVGMLKSIG